MIKRKGMVLLLFSLAMGVGAAWVANKWLTMRVMPSAEAAVGQTPVVMAALKIPYGTKVEAQHLKVINMPQEAVPEGTYRAPSEVVGWVATQTVLPGEILIKERFAEHLGGSTLSALVGSSMRALTVRVDDVVGVAGFLLPGNYVDVVSSRRVQETAVAKTIVQNVKVLAVDQTSATDKNDPIIVRAVTLEVTPPQAEDIAKASQEGKIQLTLRNPNDQRVVEAAAPPAPAPLKIAAAPARPPVITIVRGTDVSTTPTTPH
jgi:pilus assembly protein CpaB